MKFTDAHLVIPPGGWVYTDPDTGLEISADGPMALLRKVNEHREYKQLPQIERSALEAYFTAKSLQSVAGELKTG